MKVIVRVAGDFTSALATTLGADADAKSEKPVEFDAERHRSGIVIKPPTNVVLPRLSSTDHS